MFAEGDQTWAEALAARLDGRTLATVELGTGGALVALLGGAPYLRFGELVADEQNLHHASTDLAHFAQRVREVGAADIGLALFVRQSKDSHARIAIATADGVEEMQRVAFLAGDEGRRRSALACAAALWQFLAEEPEASVAAGQSLAMCHCHTICRRSGSQLWKVEKSESLATQPLRNRLTPLGEIEQFAQYGSRLCQCDT